MHGWGAAGWVTARGREQRLQKDCPLTCLPPTALPAPVQVFRRAATKMEGLLGAAGLSVSINPEGKPRKGTFEVKVGGKTKLSLVGMPRPFKKLRETDLDALAEEIIKAK